MASNNWRHCLTRAGHVFSGALHPGCWNTNRRAGAPIGNMVQIDLGAPSLGAVDTVAAAQAVAAAGFLALDTNELDVARVVSITSSGADGAIVFTVSGTDIHGMPVVEEITGVASTTVEGLKAFKRVTSVYASGVCAGNISVGDGDAIGLPYAVARVADVLEVITDGAKELATSTLVMGDFTKPATASTGDVRGTINPATALDGSKEVVVWMKADGTTPDRLGGVDQYAG